MCLYDGIGSDGSSHLLVRSFAGERATHILHGSKERRFERRMLRWLPRPTGNSSPGSRFRLPLQQVSHLSALYGASIFVVDCRVG